jgi:ankyrin repeat protein
MCRFTGLDDIEYKKVEAAFQTIISKGSRSHESTERRDQQAAWIKRSEERRKFLWDSLRFDQIDHRRTDIKRAHTKTCEWFLRNRCYLDWIDVAKLNQHTGLFWIKGKPGAGKSTLMKFILTQAENMKNEGATISFFFHSRGIELQKSTIGMYRSLLWQLLEQIPERRTCFDSPGFAGLGGSERSGWGTPQWSLERLKDLFEDAVLNPGRPRRHDLGNVPNNLKSLVCFIDALDECEERQIRDMVSFFESLCEKAVSSGNPFHVCLSSRHYPNVKMSRGLDLVLEGQAGHSQDITDYLNKKLKIGHSKLAEQIRRELQKKASGVFMWVVLVVEMLNKEYDAGRIHALRKRLNTTPGDLHELFRDILSKDEHNRNELLLCVQWVLFSRRPLTPAELYCAILSGLGENDIEYLITGDAEVTAEDIKRFLLDCSKGLVEVVSSKSSTVQFIHESVRDFLLKENGLTKLWTNLGSDFRGASHDILRQCCVTYIAIGVSSGLDFIKSPPSERTRQSAAQSFPFLKYAVQNVINHADLAEEGNISQLGFIKTFDWPNWLKLSNLFTEYEVYRHTPKVSLLYLFAENDLPNLIKTHSSSLAYFELEDDRYGSPLYASIVTRSYRALRTFLELEVQRQPNVSLLCRLLDQFNLGEPSPSTPRYRFKRGPKALNPILSFSNGILAPFLLAAGKNMELLCEHWHGQMLAAILRRDETFALRLLEAGINLQAKDAGSLILLKALTRGWEEVVKKILACGNVNIKFLNSHGLAPSDIATREGYVDVTKILINTRKVNVNSRDDKGQTSLFHAVRQGYKENVKLLLDTGEANVNSRDDKGRTPLSHAVRQGYKEIVKLLVDRREVNINSGSRYGDTPLAIASRKGYTQITRLLLGTGKAIINSKDKFGRSPLSYAAERGHHDVAALLLQSQDVDVNSRDEDHRTPLSYAAERGHSEVLTLLLASPKVDINCGDKSNWSPLLYAAYRGNKRVVKLLLQQDKVNAKVIGNDGYTALILAARAGHLAIVKLLLGMDKVDANVTTIWGLSALSMARDMGHEQVVKALLASGKINE